MSDNSYEPPPVAGDAEPTADATFERTKRHLFAIAKAQRFLVGVILTGLLFVAGLVIVRAMKLPGESIAPLFQLVLSVLQVVAMYRLGKTVYRSTFKGVLMVIFAFVPCLGLIALLVANAEATRELQRFGYRVGLLGAALSQFAEDRPLPTAKFRL
jgi:hypothetical protein